MSNSLSSTGMEVSLVSLPVGVAVVATTPRGICFVALADSAEEALAKLSADYPGQAPTPNPSAHHAYLASQVENFFAGSGQSELPLDMTGTAFQQQVWRALLDIPFGQTRSYAELAHMVGRPTSHRAVAGACAANALALVVPCHRVVQSGGKLGGYRWGVGRKRQILDLERLKSPA